MSFSDLGFNSEFVFWEVHMPIFYQNKKKYISTLTVYYNIHSIFEQCVFGIIASHRERSGVVARR